MRNLFFFIILLCCIEIRSQSEQDLEDLASGLMATMPTPPNVFSRYKISIQNLETKEWYNKNAVIVSDKKIASTVIAVIISNNLYYVFGYAPVIRNGSFTNLGEFVLYEKKDGVISKLKHSIEILSEKTEDNEIIQYFNSDKGGYVVSIKDKFEVQYMVFHGVFWSLPKDYFEYK